MSYTISSSRKVLAFKNDGIIYYILVEKTADSSLHPRKFHWSVVYFGEYDGAIKTIFDLAANCEGGMMKTPSGDILPEKYIRSWMLAMNKPLSVTDISGEISSKEFKKDTIFPDSLESEKQFEQDWDKLLLFLKNNYNTVYNQLTKNGEMTSVYDTSAHCYYDLPQHPKILLFIKNLQSMKNKGFWRFMHVYERTIKDAECEPCDPSLITKEASTTLSYTVPKILKIKNSENLLISEDGINYHCEGWRYQVIGNFVKDIWKINGKYVKNYRELIEGFREEIISAEEAINLDVSIDLTLINKDFWYGNKVHEIAKIYGNKFNVCKNSIIHESMNALLACKDGVIYTVA